MVLPWEVQHLEPQEKIICKLMNVLQYLWHYTFQMFGSELLMTCILFLNVRNEESVFHHINNLHQNIKFTMVGESNGEIAFLDTLLKGNNGVISVLVYRNPTNTDKYLHDSAHNQTSYKFFLPYLISYSIITNKAHLYNENAIIKQVLRENGYQESIIS